MSDPSPKKAPRRSNYLVSSRRAGELFDNARPPSIESFSVENRRAAGFDKHLVATVVTVVFVEFGKALLGEFAKRTWEFLLGKLRSIRTKARVEMIYTSHADPRTLVDVVLRYPSAKALRQDQDQQRIYLALAAAYACVHMPKVGESISLMKLVPANAPKKPTEFIIRRSQR